MTTATTPTRIPNDIQLRFWRAEDRMLAARVPDADRDHTAPAEPVTCGGYYLRPTKSGRPAWALIEWRDGQPRELHCTYDLHAERIVNSLVNAGADPFWTQES